MDTTLQRSDSVRHAPIATNASSAGQAVAQGAGRLWALSPRLWIALGAVGLIVWSVLEASDRRTMVALATLALLAGGSLMAGSSSHIGRKFARLVDRDILNVVGVAALATGAVLSADVMSPFVLLLPVGVGLAALSNRDAIYTDISLLVGLAGLIATGLRTTIWLDAAYAPTILFLGCIGFLTVASYLVADAYSASAARGTASRSRRPGRSALTPEQLAQLSNVESPIETIRAAADILNDAVSPAYLAIVEQIPDTNVLRPLVERGSLDVDADRLRSGLAALSHEYIPEVEPRALFQDGTNLDSIACRRLGASAILIMPLRRMGAGLGAIQVVWADDRAEDRVEQARELSTHLAQWITPDIAISRVASEMERGYINAIAAVSSSLDDQFSFTSGHSHRVARTALEIAELLPLSDHDQRQLVYAAEMHDLGRVGIDHAILSKPEALSDEEWTTIKSIPARGAGIVDPVSYFGEVGEAIRHLRERWDGEGYPDGLCGEKIPLLSRIIAIAEAYDSMTSNRPYREAMDPTDALRQLWFDRGKKFDPGIVEAFVMSRAPRATSRL